MWEDLKVYKQLDPKEINSALKRFSTLLGSLVKGYSVDQTNSIIKLSRHVNHLEQSVFIEKVTGSYNLKVKTSIKPIDFYRRHRFTMINIVPVGTIMNNYRKTFYPLTQEWNDLAMYLATIISREIGQYFDKYDSYSKIIDRRKEIEPKNVGIDNKYELLIYAAIKTKNKPLLDYYLEKKMARPVMRITKSEHLKPVEEIDEFDFLQQIKIFAEKDDFASIESKIAGIHK